MTYKVELIQSEEGFAVSCPSLPGCWSQGETEEEALANIQSAISDYLEAESALGERKKIRFVDVPSPAKPMLQEPFTVEPFHGLNWPEEFNKTEKAAEWIAYLDQQHEQGTSCS